MRAREKRLEAHALDLPERRARDEWKGDLMKHLLAVTIVAALAASFLIVRSTESSKAQTQSVYFGFLLGGPRVAAVAIDLAAPDANGQRALRAYVCDGLGQPALLTVAVSRNPVTVKP